MQQVETILAPHVETELSPDQFQDPAWAKAPPIQIAREWSGEDAPVSRHAEARIVWSAESLAVRFVCRQDEPLIVHSNPQLDKKTIGVWDRDVCELFIAPDASAPGRYFEFQAAPTGEWVDLAINFTAAGRETDFEFHSGMSAAAIVSEGVTTIAMRIPWSDLIPKPQRGDAWRVNLFRCVGTGNERYLAWRPTYTSEPNFHVPEVFGWLRFV
jgi:cellulose/xylan binding protein with CBM9 domain